MLFGFVNVDFPNSITKTLEWNILNQKVSIQMPGFLFSSLFYLGIGTLTYFVSRKLFCWFRRTRCYFKSFGNASKFLSCKRADITYSAVIYGASTTIGKLYAHYLASHGFNLILIERDMNQLNLLEVNLNTELLNRIKITKIVIDKFDQDSMWRALYNTQVSAHTDISPVKVFVNCKNSKRKATSVEVEKF
jgi:hypothetical protein